MINYGANLLQGMQTGANISFNKQEMRMRAQRLQEDVLTAQLNRELSRLDQSLRQQQQDFAEEVGRDNMKTAAKNRELLSEQIRRFAQDTTQGERDYKLGDDWDVLDSSLPGTMVNQATLTRLVPYLNAAKSGQLQREAYNSQKEFDDEMAKLIGDLQTEQATQAAEENQTVTTLGREWVKLDPALKEQYGSRANYVAQKSKEMGIDISGTREERYVNQAAAMKAAPWISVNVPSKLSRAVVNTWNNIFSPENERTLSTQKIRKGWLVSPEDQRVEELSSQILAKMARRPRYSEPYQRGGFNIFSNQQVQGGLLQNAQGLTADEYFSQTPINPLEFIPQMQTQPRPAQ